MRFSVAAVARLVLATAFVVAVRAGVSAPPKDLPAKAKTMPKHLSRRMTCSICETVVDEVEGSLSTEKHKVQVSWRMDDKKYVEQARSEARVLELLEDLPERFGDYGVREEKKGPDGKPYDKLVPFKKKSGSSGGMTISGGVSISAGKQDEMRIIYEWMTEEHLDDMVNFFRKKPGTAHEMKKILCVDFFKSCPAGWFDPQPEGPAVASEKEKKEAKEKAEKAEREAKEKAEKEAKAKAAAAAAAAAAEAAPAPAEPAAAEATGTDAVPAAAKTEL